MKPTKVYLHKGWQSHKKYKINKKYKMLTSFRVTVNTFKFKYTKYKLALNWQI